MAMDPVSKYAATIRSLPAPLLLAFDIDGTLAPIVKDPAKARIPPKVKQAIEELAQHPDITVALITGRDGSALRAIFDLPQAWKSVEHGRVILKPHMSYETLKLSPEENGALEDYRAWLGAQGFARSPALVEEKPSSVTLHVRELVEEDPLRAATALQRAEQEAQRRGLVVRRAKAACEVGFAHRDKGDALAMIFEETKAESVFYAGDDTTDLPALRKAAELGGIAIFIASEEGPEAPSCHAVFDDIAEMHQLVLELAEVFGERNA